MSVSATSRTALVTGGTGQDAFYLIRDLLARGDRVIAGVRDPDDERARSLSGELPGVEVEPLELGSPEEIDRYVRKSVPDLVFHLGGVSSVGKAWADPLRAMRINCEGTIALMQAVRHHAPAARFVFAGSGDCYDHEFHPERGIDPTTPLLATNPYSVSKAAATQFVRIARTGLGLHASVAILTNHTSPRRPEAFIERRIIRGAARIARGEAETLRIGSVRSRRDWAWAEDVVRGMLLMADADKPADHVFASGETHTTGDWVRLVFARLGVDPEGRVIEDVGLQHQGDRPHTFGNISATREKLGWSPEVGFEEIIERMIEAELAHMGA